MADTISGAPSPTAGTQHKRHRCHAVSSAPQRQAHVLALYDHSWQVVSLVAVHDTHPSCVMHSRISQASLCAAAVQEKHSRPACQAPATCTSLTWHVVPRVPHHAPDVQHFQVAVAGHARQVA
jgi:hypothetical protein